MSSKDNNQDWRLFHEEMADVKPLQHNRVAARKPPPPPRPLQREQDERQVMDELMDPPDPAEIETGEELLYFREGLQRRVRRQLRRGQFPPTAWLDLHGMTSLQARRAVAEFLQRCRKERHRCVRIIHGKGKRSSNHGPVLKRKVDYWLRQRDEVLAFCSALPSDGGTGAAYVLLRLER
ncbi:DNA-nicking Smr family endonuclease [Alkalispirillum mobile]|uniref:DNA-nicking Smr family endonuclease n=1 Tax=Alkalispirillum mobile TaxID=85925 RepID=A0A498C5V5_9GAMM|nr:Smr/MutS family protein [Alkalispirillum mobile]RLK50693.1 DNA-nicking Smr family endonuclease [Alkalispirillum mobile]